MPHPAAGGVPESLRAASPPFHKFISIIAGFCPAVFTVFLRFASAPRDLPGRPDKSPGPAPGAGLWFAEGLVEGRLDLGQKADKGDGLQCYPAPQNHALYSPRWRPPPPAGSPHPGGDGGKGHTSGSRAPQPGSGCSGSRRPGAPPLRAPPLPDGAGGVNHVFCGQFITLCNLSLPGLTAVEGTALGQQLRAGRPVDGLVHRRPQQGYGWRR